MLVMRRHRSRPSGGDVLILTPALFLACLTWIAPEAPLIGAGLAAHLAWFVFCEKQFPPPQLAAAQAAAATTLPRPVLQSLPAPSAPASIPLTIPVLAVFDETPDVKTFRLLRPDGFDFDAGQFLTVRVQVEGRTVQRAYSISSAPLSRGYIEISVKRIGLVSSVLHANLRPGSLVAVRPPAGAFTYPAGDDRPLLLLAGGIGITPLMSMLRHAVATQPTRRVALIYSVRTPDDLAFRDELAVIARRHPQVRVVIAVTQGPASDRWHYGHINASIVQAYTADLAHTLAYICGPAPMMDAMKSLLRDLGVPAAQVRNESFGAAMKLVAGEADASPALVGRAAVAAAPRAPGSANTVRFARTGCDAPIAPTQTILEAAEARGVDLPSMCRAGTCHTCRTRLVAGDVDCRSDSLSAEDRAAGFILPCVSHARSDCELEA